MRKCRKPSMVFKTNLLLTNNGNDENFSINNNNNNNLIVQPHNLNELEENNNFINNEMDDLNVNTSDNLKNVDDISIYVNEPKAFDLNNAYNSLIPFKSNKTDEFQYSNILNAIREIISCCACFSSDIIMKECSNGHLICQNCFLTLRQDDRPQCPTCRTGLHSDNKKALIAQKVFSELPDSCTDCHLEMLNKSIIHHRLHVCCKRLVTCIFRQLGCQWIGPVEKYKDHYSDCYTHKYLLEKSTESILRDLLHCIKTHNEFVRETCQQFFTIFKNLDYFEVQNTTILLTCVNATETNMIYRSDVFHTNQSRWVIEIFFTFTKQHNLLNNNCTINDNDCNNKEQINNNDSLNLFNITSTNTISYSNNANNLNQPTSPTSVAIRKRKRFANYSSRHHPYFHHNHYHHQYKQPFLFKFRSLNSTNENLFHQFNFTTPIQSSSSNSYQSNQIDNNLISLSNLNSKNEISYRIIKQNNPNIGRKIYSFYLVQLKVPEMEVEILIKPKLETHRFTMRGETTSTYEINPIQFKNINNLDELFKYRLIHAEFMIARKLNDDINDS